MTEASSGALDSAPAVNTELSACKGLDAPVAGPLIFSALSRSVLAVLGPPGLCLSRGRPNPGLCPGPVLPDLRCWILAPGWVGTSPRSRHSPSELLLEPQSPLHTKPLPLP